MVAFLFIYFYVRCHLLVLNLLFLLDFFSFNTFNLFEVYHQSLCHTSRYDWILAYA